MTDAAPLPRLSHRVQSLLLRVAFAVLRRIGPVASSNLGGAVARAVGPLLPVSRVAHANLRRFLPELDAGQRRRVVREVWDNLGRTVAELPHLGRFRRTAAGPGWEIAGYENVRRFVEAGEQVVFVSGHIGNWELMLPIAYQHGVRLAGVYRAPSNATADALIQRVRDAAMDGRVPMFAKGAGGARAVLKYLGTGGSLGMLMDQKMNDGIAVPFFGAPAMTAPAAALFAQKFGAPLIPAHIVRLGPARFRMVVDPPIHAADTGDRRADMLTTTQAINDTLERWIRARPGSWLWLHRRWPKPA